MRATMSVAPPGANGTINRTGFVGQSVARSAALTASVSSAHTAAIAMPDRHANSILLLPAFDFNR
jgi:hypothetical protein